ncbi:hypothetical protein N7528_001392 [Penicillium herquei]|nr:hypothetical protein N7528_001392 [Penicillium herquei]
MHAESEETHLQPRTEIEYDPHFLLLAIYSIFVTFESLYVKLEAIDTAKDEFHAHCEAGSLLIAQYIGQQIVRYYDEVEEIHQVIENGLNRVWSIMLRAPAMRELMDYTE